MIHVVLDDACSRKLKGALKRAGPNEIGGILAAENLGGGVFKIVAISIQRSGGSFARFVRQFGPHDRFMRRFFDSTGHEYQRFNYLGEWHSHPSFPALPSGVDLRQMQLLAEESDQRATFLVLLIAKLGTSGALEASAHAFVKGAHPMRVHLSGNALARERGDAIGYRSAVRDRLALNQETTRLVRQERQ